MSQIWSPPDSTTLQSQALVTDLPNMAASLRSNHSGATAPTSTVAYMWWADTANGLLKMRDSANTGWWVMGVLGGDPGDLLVVTQFGSVSATTTKRLTMLARAATITAVWIWSATTTSSSSGNEWTFGLTEVVTAEALFSTTVGTFTTDVDIGGGEVTADVPDSLVLVPDQNTERVAGEGIKLAITKVGSPTTMTDVVVGLRFAITT
jgi:hypothetical protein